jgi:hypothetical protein
MCLTIRLRWGIIRLTLAASGDYVGIIRLTLPSVLDLGRGSPLQVL